MPILRFPTGGYDAVGTNRSLGLGIPGLTYAPTGGYDVLGTNRARATAGGSAGGGAARYGGGGSDVFDLHPQPTSGNGPFGAVPGQLGLPDPAGDLAHQIPGLSNLNSAASSGILAKLNGQLSPGTLNALKNASAQFGVSSGMPGSGLSSSSFLGNVAGASEAQQTEGIHQYNSFVPTVSGTQTVNPALQNEIATQNSLNAAAPDPTQAASYAKQLFDQYLSSMRGSGGGNRGPGGGTSNQGSPAGGTMPRQASPNNYFNPQSIAPTGPGTFGGSSSYDPTDAQWFDDFYAGFDGPSAPQGSYGVMAPEFDSGYTPYDSGVPDYGFDEFYDFDY